MLYKLLLATESTPQHCSSSVSVLLLYSLGSFVLHFHKAGSARRASQATFWGLLQLPLVFMSQLCWDADPTRASHRPESLHAEVTVQQLTFK